MWRILMSHPPNHACGGCGWCHNCGRALRAVWGPGSAVRRCYHCGAIVLYEDGAPCPEPPDDCYPWDGDVDVHPLVPG
jgi:hypothetical protein